jgi:D-apiose dehydrogenase
VRVAYVGLGWAASAFHLPALKRQNGNATAVGGCDSDPGRRSAWEKVSGSPAYTTLDELLDRSRPDLVVVATPPDSHAELCLMALDAGAHVLCEKPFVSSLEEADAVIDRAESAGRFVAVNHEFREKPIFRALHERIGSPEAGRLVFCQIWQLMDLAPWDEPVAWRAAMPNRTLFEGGVHLVDLIVMLFGEIPDAVYARHSSGLEPGRTADAIHLVTLEFGEGRLAQITIDRLCQAGTRYVEVRADCERESLRASLGGRALVRIGMKRAQRTGVRVDYGAGGLAWAERGNTRKVLARNSRDAAVVGTARLLEQMLDAIRENHEPPSSAREARDVMRVIDAAYRSASTGERVELNPRSSAREAAG